VRASWPLLVVWQLACAPASWFAPDSTKPAELSSCFAALAAELASDAMEGRGIATPGLERSASLIESRLRADGLEAVSGDYRQSFQIQLGVREGEGGVLARVGGENVDPQNWTPLRFSSVGSFEGPLVFAGYGTRAPPLDYDDYAGLDVAGSVVLALRYEPGEDDDDSPFDGRRATRWSDLRYKAFLAREAGAKALILVDGPAAAKPGEAERLPRLEGGGPVSPAGLPVLQVRREVAARWLSAAGLDLRALQRDIDSQSRPHSHVLPGVSIRGTVSLDVETHTASNVLALWPGRGDLAHQAVVVGAHYDHLGYGDRSSMRPGVRAIHNGADDNASGVAAMLCAVDALVAHPPGGPRRSLVVVAFSAEELGLLGSGHYVEAPAVPLSRTVAMLNLDMVGRLGGKPLSLLGGDSSPDWPELAEASTRGLDVEIELGGDGYGPSDQMSFYTRGVPVLHLFTGAHEDYHAPSDDVSRLDVEGGGLVSAFLRRLLGELLVREQPLIYARSAGPPTLGADRRSRGAWLGSIPDYSAMEETSGGVLLSGVIAGGPAETAGMRAGDRIVWLEGVEVANLYDLTFALREHEPGDAVQVEVERDRERRRLRVVLGDRAQRASPASDPHHSGGGHGEPGD